MPDLVADTSSPYLVTSSAGERVRISRGPLQGLTGLIAELEGDEALIDLRGTISGLFVRCRLAHLASSSELQLD